MCKRIFYSCFVLIILILSACSTPSTKSKKHRKKKRAKTTISNYSKIDKLFKEISFDSFYVQSSFGFEKSNFKFHGKKMDSLQIEALPHDIRRSYQYNKDIAACYKFSMNEKEVGLIVRCGGEYSSTAIKLFVFDLGQDSVTASVNLADVFGDAGEFMSYQSCIFKDETEDLQILTYRHSSYHEIDDTVEFVTESYSLLNDSTHWNKPVSTDSMLIVTAYPEMINKLSGSHHDHTFASISPLCFESIPKSSQKTILVETIQLWKTETRVKGRGIGSYMMGGPVWFFDFNGTAINDTILEVNINYKERDQAPFSTTETWVLSEDMQDLKFKKLEPEHLRGPSSGRFFQVDCGKLHHRTREKLENRNFRSN